MEEAEWVLTRQGAQTLGRAATVGQEDRAQVRMAMVAMAERAAWEEVRRMILRMAALAAAEGTGVMALAPETEETLAAVEPEETGTTEVMAVTGAQVGMANHRETELLAAMGGKATTSARLTMEKEEKTDHMGALSLESPGCSAL